MTMAWKSGTLSTYKEAPKRTRYIGIRKVGQMCDAEPVCDLTVPHDHGGITGEPYVYLLCGCVFTKWAIRDPVWPDDGSRRWRQKGAPCERHRGVNWSSLMPATPDQLESIAAGRVRAPKSPRRRKA